MSEMIKSQIPCTSFLHTCLRCKTLIRSRQPASSLSFAPCPCVLMKGGTKSSSTSQISPAAPMGRTTSKHFECKFTRTVESGVSTSQTVSTLRRSSLQSSNFSFLFRKPRQLVRIHLFQNSTVVHFRVESVFTLTKY